MKKSTLLLILIQAVAVSMYAQTTNFGTGSSGSGPNNSHFGYWAGLDGANNSFFGHLAGTRSTAGLNTAMGSRALTYNTSGYYNTAIGAWAMQNNTTGAANIAIGYRALYGNTLGYENIAIGVYSLDLNTTGYRNTANGISALASNTGGYQNIAVGYSALFRNTTGTYNTGSGPQALYNNTTGSFNSAFGYLAGPGTYTPDLNNTTALGQGATPTGSNQVRIGNSSVVSIRGQVNWSALSDGRFKRDLKEDVAGLEFINRLRPVSYSLDKEAIDKFLGVPDSVRQLFPKSEKNVRESGFIAQEVEEVVKKGGYVFHGVEVPQNENDYYGIRYAEFVVPLVKAVQELTAKLEMQEKFAQEQKKEMDVLKQQLKMSGTSTVDEYNSKTEVALYQNNPNPFTVTTEIGMSLPENIGQATLIIYNMEGNQLKVIPVNDRGKAVVKIESNELKAGMYFYSLLVDGKVLDTKRMILTSY
jgi:hypothetical protein